MVGSVVLWLPSYFCCPSSWTQHLSDVGYRSPVISENADSWAPADLEAEALRVSLWNLCFTKFRKPLSDPGLTTV
jgi:hypothetical protein